MDLQEFIKLTLTQVVQGVADAQEVIKQSGKNAYIAPVETLTGRNLPQEVKFDVAVTASEKTEKGGKAGVEVIGLKFGVNLGQNTGLETISRIQFAVPVSLPGEQPTEDERYRKDKAENLKRASERSRENLGKLGRTLG